MATATVRGRLPKSSDPHRILAEAAGRLTRHGSEPGLNPTLRNQVAWMVTDRVGLAAHDSPPEFDPSGLKPRDRWETLQNVLDPARKLTAAFGVAIGVDLVASPLPRMTIVDDRVVPANRRHRLPAASLDQLPVGQWVDVGPYTAAEWESRGEQASGRGAYLRLNKTAYIVAVEHGDTAAWRLEDVAARTGDGILATGTANSLDDARNDATNTLQGRYPALDPQRVDVAAPIPAGAIRGWEPMPGEGSTSAELRRLDERTTVYVIPGPGGRWMPAVHHAATGDIDRLPLTRTVDDAKHAAVLAGYRTIRLAAMDTPAKFDPMLAAFADSGDYSRRELTALLTSRLEAADSARLPDATPADLIELVGAAGASPATTVAILHAEAADPRTVAELLPTVGVPIPDAIRVLHERWEMPRPEAAELLDATAAEMRTAGCTPVEIIAARPRDVLRSLPDEPHLWELAAGTMALAGHSAATIANHLVAHAPSPDAFAAALTAGIDDPTAGVAVAVRSGAQGDQLAAVTEAYGLAPAEAATLLTDHGCQANVLLDTLDIRCDHDTQAVTGLAGHAGIDTAAIEAWMNPTEPIVPPIARWGGLDLGDADELLARLPTPSPTRQTSPPSSTSNPHATWSRSAHEHRTDQPTHRRTRGRWHLATRPRRRRRLPPPRYPPRHHRLGRARRSPPLATRRSRHLRHTGRNRHRDRRCHGRPDRRPNLDPNRDPPLGAD
ncbi:MAG TPA: hypothetical protein PLV68_18755, partial [Ilumatobacteraceae bacterium]|nr:hypothetical protein [Ilumatobacteraceae bacterium]